MVGGRAESWSWRQLHEKSSWEGQKHGQMHRWRQMGWGRVPPLSLALGSLALPSAPPDSPHRSTGFLFPALPLPRAASYQ